MRFAIIVIAYKEEANLKRSLQALVSQESAQFKWEIVVVDNDPALSAKPIVLSFEKDNPIIKIKYLNSEENNVGLARAMGVKSTEAQFVLFLDSDCLPGKSWLSEMAERFERAKSQDHQIAGMGAPACIPSDPKEKGADFLLSLMLKSFFGHFGSPQGEIKGSGRYLEHLPTSNVIFDRKKILGVGNFDPRFAKVCEDVDMGIRLNRAGYKLIWAESPAVAHFTDTTIEGWFKRMLRFGEGRFKVFCKYPMSLSFHGYLPLFAVLTSLIFFLYYVELFYFLLVVYLIVLSLQSLALCFKFKSLEKTPLLLFVFFFTHFAYYLGVCMGVVKKLINLKQK